MTPRYDVIVPTYGHGNIGDQAMFEAFLDRAEKPVVAVFSSRDALTVPDGRAHETTVAHAPNLVSGPPIGRLRARGTFAGVLQGARSFSIVGADIMDGTYTRREALLRLDMARLAVRAGIPTRVLGFSWSDKPDPAVVSAMRELAPHVDFLARDPRSLERLQSAGVASQLVADVVFARDDVRSPIPDVESWLAGRPYAVLNTSGLIDGRIDLSEDYSAVARALTDRGLAVVVLPHVARPGDDDRIPAKRLMLDADLGLWHLCSDLPSPSEVAWLAADAELVVTGRMHLAILAATVGTPAVTLGTQGKVEGLMDLLGVPDLVLAPVRGVGGAIIERVDSILQDGGRYADLISTGAAQARELAQLNYGHA